MDKVCAGIVLYEPDYDRLLENISSVSKQTEHIYLVDNGSSNIETIRFSLSNKDNITLIENSNNFGIAKALNQLCLAAKEDGYNWILTLDQDSVASDNMMEEMLPYLSIADTAIVAPFVDDDFENQVIRNSGEREIEDITRCNTSGCVTNLLIWEELGGFDERMFIDCVDFDYCTRALKYGYRVIRVNKAVLHHRLGKAKEVRFFMPFGKLFGIEKLRRPFYTYNHSPLRTYYYARNILYYMHKHKDFIDMKQERRTYFRWFVLKVFFESQRFKKLCAIIKGTAHSKKLIKEYKKSL